MTGAIILAAGSSSRMGQSKQMLDIHGEPLLLKTVHAAISAELKNIIVVLGANEKAHREMLRNAPVDIAINAGWQTGMGSSIKTGLQRLLAKNPKVGNVLILVCDQPLLTSDIITGLLKRYRETGKLIVASGYSTVPGVPVLFHKNYFGQLATLPDDQGAKKLIARNPLDVAIVPFPGGEIDLDTREDYDAFIAGGL